MQNTYQTEEIEEHCRSTNQLKRANGWSYPLAGGTRERQFDGTSFKPRKELENAQSPTCRVHAVLGRLAVWATITFCRDIIITPAGITKILACFVRDENNFI